MTRARVRAGVAMVTVAEVRQRWSELFDRVRNDGKRVVVTRHGVPRVAIVSMDDLEILRRYWPEPVAPDTEAVVKS